MILFSFPLGGYVDEVVDNQKKLSRIQVPSFPSLLHIDSHLFLEW